MQSHNHTDPGVSTGMLYLGGRKAEVRAAVYDKRNERLDRGFPDPGPTLRAELRLSGKMGITLRDLVSCDPCYWHYMGNLFPRPSGVPLWVPNDSDYKLEPAMPLEPYELLRRRVETSPDIAHILDIASRLGPHGYETLLMLLERRQEAFPVQPSASNEAA